MESEGETPGPALAFALLPISKVLVMCALGLLMATPYVNILNSSARKALSKLVFSLFLPCLLFTQLGQAVTLEKIGQWWFLPVNVVLASVFGSMIGYVVALLVKPPPQFFGLTVVMIGIGNIGNIPLVLIGAVCRDRNNPFGEPKTCNGDGVAYISFGQWVGALIVYTYAYRMLAPPDTCATSENSVVIKMERPKGTSAYTTPLLADMECEDLEEPDHEIPELAPSKMKTAVMQGMCYAKHLRLTEIFQPPVVVSLLALTIGSIPVLKKQIFEEHSIFFFVYDALNMMGSAMIPSIMLVLGGNLVGGPGDSKLGMRTTVTIVLVRLFIMPLMGLGIVMAADTLGFIPAGDKMFKFVLLLQHSMPSSVLAGTVANLRGHAEREASAILFWEHVCATLSMAGWLILFMNILF